MKGNRLYIILLFVFILLVFVYQYFTPKEFVWNPTFNKYDKQPFGSYVFDDVMSTSFADYKVENKTFYQLYREYGGTRDLEPVDGPINGLPLYREYGRTRDLEREVALEEWEKREMEIVGDFRDIRDNGEAGEIEESNDLTVLPSYGLPTERRAFLITEDYISFSAVDVKALLNLLNQGHKIMICLHSFPPILCDSLCFSYEYNGFYSISLLTRFTREGNLRDSLFLGTDSLKPERIYEVYPHLHPIVLKEGRQKNWLDTDSLVDVGKLRCDWSEIWVRNSDGNPLAMRLGKGEGELFLVATPLMFTNYGMLDGDNASYAFRLLSAMKDMPLTRIEAYGRFADQASGSPLRYLLSQPPLQWAVYTAMISILLCMIFTAKRRQRIIPVVRPPANETLRFTQLIGNLYYQRKDYKDMLQKKYLYFCTEVKQLNGLDLHADEPDEELCHRLADKTGQDFRDIWPVFRELKYLLRENAVVDETSMMRFIDKMNEWLISL